MGFSSTRNYHTGVRSTISACKVKGVWGMPPARKFLKIRCQKNEFGGTSTTKIKILVAVTLKCCWMKAQNHHGVKQKRGS